MKGSNEIDKEKKREEDYLFKFSLIDRVITLFFRDMNIIIKSKD